MTKFYYITPKLLLIIIALFISININSQVKSEKRNMHPVPFFRTINNGNYNLNIKVKGEKNNNIVVTEQGYIVKKDKNGIYKYIKKDINNEYKLSKRIARNKDTKLRDNYVKLKDKNELREYLKKRRDKNGIRKVGAFIQKENKTSKQKVGELKKKKEGI